MLSDALVQEYKALYQKHFRRVLSEDEARTKANETLTFFKTLLEYKYKKPDSDLKGGENNNVVQNKSI